MATGQRAPESRRGGEPPTINDVAAALERDEISSRQILKGNPSGGCGAGHIVAVDRGLLPR